MSKYKVGDKIILTVTGMTEMGNYPHYVLNDNFYLWKQSIDKYSEPLHTYTEPLEVKIRRQAAEITRLLAENKRLKAENGNGLWNIEQARAEGQNEAWGLAKKIVGDVRDGGYSAEELGQIFRYLVSQPCIVENTYPEAAAKVAEWEKAKGKICVGDVVRFKGNNNVEFCVTDILDDSFLYGINAEGCVYSNRDIELFDKTGRHIDIDNFLKQIGGEQE